MGQDIDLIVSVLGETSLVAQIGTRNILDNLKLSDANKIFGKDGLKLKSSCENCSHSIQLNLYWNGEKKFQLLPEEDLFDDQIKEDNDTVSEPEVAWVEPNILIKEEPMDASSSKVKLENNFISYPNVPYSLPPGLSLPSFDNIRAPFFTEITDKDGITYYVERKRQKVPVRVTNYDPRSTICDICNYKVPSVDRMTAHRKGHFFNKYGNDNCRGCGLFCGGLSSEEKANHTFVCPGKSTINGLLCTECNYQAKDYKKIKSHMHKVHRISSNDTILAPSLDEMKKKQVKKSSDKAKNLAIDEYLSYLTLPESYVLPNLYTLNAQHSKMHPQPDGTSIYVGKGTNHLQVMNFDPRREKCDLCGKSQLKNKPDLIAHRFKEHFFPAHAGNQCQGCHREYENSEAKMAHSHFCDKKHLIKVNFCRKCNEQFPAYPKFVSHIKKVHNGDGIDLKYMCHLCSSTFERPTQLELHVIKHQDPKPYKCAHCEAEYKGRHGLETHLIRIHFRHEAKNICNACQPPALFGSTDQYKTHLNIVHFTNSKEKQECPYCKKLIRKLGLAHHIRQQHTNKGHKEKFECSKCNKIFFSKKNLEIHSVIHLPEDQRHFRCRFCGRSFNFKQHLIAHERSHTGEKPFKCDTCSKAFARKQALTDHQREHTGQGYPCSVCGRMFSDRGNYRHHMKQVNNLLFFKKISFLNSKYQQHESQMGVKLTFNHEERRLMRLKVLTAEQALKGGLNDDF